MSLLSGEELEFFIFYFFSFETEKASCFEEPIFVAAISAVALKSSKSNNRESS